VPFQGLDQLETSLCDFNSLVKGRYYIGHEMDLMMEGLEPQSIFWEARAKALAHNYLGEFKGWHGVRPELKTIYRDKGLIFV